MRKLAWILLLTLTLPAAGWADVPVPRDMQQRAMQEDLDKNIKGLGTPQQRAKVQQMLAEIPKKKTELDKQIVKAQEDEDHGHRSTPAYMLRKERSWLDEHETFLKNWLTAHKAQSSRFPGAGAPLAMGCFFLTGGLLLGGRRVLGRA